MANISLRPLALREREREREREYNEIKKITVQGITTRVIVYLGGSLYVIHLYARNVEGDLQPMKGYYNGDTILPHDIAS